MKGWFGYGCTWSRIRAGPQDDVYEANISRNNRCRTIIPSSSMTFSRYGLRPFLDLLRLILVRAPAVGILPKSGLWQGPNTDSDHAKGRRVPEPELAIPQPFGLLQGHNQIFSVICWTDAAYWVYRNLLRALFSERAGRGCPEFSLLVCIGV